MSTISVTSYGEFIMAFSINSSLSAIKAFGTKLGVHANNVANSDSEGFKKRRVILRENATSGVQVNIEKVETPIPLNTESTSRPVTEKERSDVDLAEEFPQILITKRGFESNLMVLKTYDEMIGSIIDLLG